MSDPYHRPQGTGQQLWPSEQPRQSTGWASNPYAAPAYPGAASGPVPLWAPLYSASFGEAVARFFMKYATFSGRASRSEYWWWALVSGVVSGVTNLLMLAGRSGGGKLGAVYFVGLALAGIWLLATFIPSLALLVRRLHDSNRSGWMVLLSFVPFIGGLVLLVFTLQDSKPEGQRFDVPTWKTGAVR
ncbi:DUF805 domain-containing protein [Arthrobacter sp. YAF34]|uniref:DUF805 domain-containing protein n=1 Tax=Arthrobacter sp. YAF34 TaxID=3233083 RepID=UPI003F8EDAA4